MKLSDLFKKNKKIDSKEEKKDEAQSQDNAKRNGSVSYDKTSEGELEVKYWDTSLDYHRYPFYDTTKLIISDDPIEINDKKVYRCKVSWYSRNDCVSFDKNIGKFEGVKEKEYQEVLVEADLDYLKNDMEYVMTLMGDLMNKERIEKYLARGLEDNPVVPCGNYIGAIRKSADEYQKVFHLDIGKEIHNSEQMVEKRKQHNNTIESNKKSIRDNKQAQIEKLKKELEELDVKEK